MSSRPLDTKMCDTLYYNSALPSSLSIDITRRVRSFLSFTLSQATADNKHAAGINLSGLPVTQLRHTHPAQYITCCVFTLHFKIPLFVADCIIPGAQLKLAVQLQNDGISLWKTAETAIRFELGQFRSVVFTVVKQVEEIFLKT